MSNTLRNRVDRIARAIEDRARWQGKGRPVFALMFEPRPPFRALSPEERAAIVDQARAAAGDSGQVTVIEWGPRWENARDALNDAFQDDKLP